MYKGVWDGRQLLEKCSCAGGNPVAFQIEATTCTTHLPACVTLRPYHKYSLLLLLTEMKYFLGTGYFCVINFRSCHGLQKRVNCTLFSNYAMYVRTWMSESTTPWHGFPVSNEIHKPKLQGTLMRGCPLTESSWQRYSSCIATKNKPVVRT